MPNHLLPVKFKNISTFSGLTLAAFSDIAREYSFESNVVRFRKYLAILSSIVKFSYLNATCSKSWVLFLIMSATYEFLIIWYQNIWLNLILSFSLLYTSPYTPLALIHYILLPFSCTANKYKQIRSTCGELPNSLFMWHTALVQSLCAVRSREFRNALPAFVQVRLKA